MNSSRAAASFKRWQVRQTIEALKKNSEAVRSVCDIREWVTTQEHLLALCDDPGCGGCDRARSMLESLRPLLPSMPERRGDSGGEVTGMGTRVTRFGGEDGDTAAFGDEDDRDWK